ncbi:MAG TPA: D-alanine--D-alanine ligase family protein [Vicinamibacterales bacterium]|nr:D-alanine--D-alanine ligase family protein [Vicinamibacterales bacterium]
MKQLRVGVIYGGRSGEHEVSVASAAAIFKHLDRARYDAVPIRIEKDGRWVLADRAPTAISAAEVISQARAGAGRLPRTGRDTLLVPHPSDDTLLTIERRPGADQRDSEPDAAVVTGLGLDVVFPVLHGPFGEDGTVQGLLELGAVPYVGSGVLASAAGMDKAAMKALFAARGLPMTPHVVVTHFEWTRHRSVRETAIAALGLPVFVKPANLGSSVGISKVKTADALADAMDMAFQFDCKAVVEAAVPDAREIECAVLGNDEPAASVPGEVIPSREFYDYEAKYIDAASQTLIPADLDVAVATHVQQCAIEAFRAIDGAGMARVDFLLSRTTGALVVNEINTIPGFTTISMFAKLWEASGVAYADLLDRLITLALERHREKQQLRTSAF